MARARRGAGRAGRPFGKRGHAGSRTKVSRCGRRECRYHESREANTLVSLSLWERAGLRETGHGTSAFMVRGWHECHDRLRRCGTVWRFSAMQGRSEEKSRLDPPAPAIFPRRHPMSSPLTHPLCARALNSSQCRFMDGLRQLYCWYPLTPSGNELAGSGDDFRLAIRAGYYRFDRHFCAGALLLAIS